MFAKCLDAYADFKGKGFTTTAVTIKPVDALAIIDYKDTNLKQVTIDGGNVKENRSAENVQYFYFID